MYSIIPLSFDKFKVLEHCKGLPIFLFEPEPSTSTGLFSLKYFSLILGEKNGSRKRKSS